MDLTNISPTTLTLIVIAMVFEFIMKGITLWRCGRNHQLGWYVAIFVINSAGILPLIYLLGFQKKDHI